MKEALCVMQVLHETDPLQRPRHVRPLFSHARKTKLLCLLILYFDHVEMP